MAPEWYRVKISEELQSTTSLSMFVVMTVNLCAACSSLEVSKSIG